VKPVLVDSNVLLDIASRDPDWYTWSSSTLAAPADETILFINPLIFAEVSIGYGRIGAVEAALPAGLLRRAPSCMRRRSLPARPSWHTGVGEGVRRRCFRTST
jgi:hypothetical protein